MKTLSMQRPLPSIEIRVPARFSLSVQAKDVNCEPWSVFMIPGAPKRWMAYERCIIFTIHLTSPAQHRHLCQVMFEAVEQYLENVG